MHTIPKCPPYSNDFPALVLSRQSLGLATFVTETALPTNVNAKILPKALPLQLLSTMAEMQLKADKLAKAAFQRYERHTTAKMRECSRFHVGQPVYVGCKPLLTSVAGKMSVEAY